MRHQILWLCHFIFWLRVHRGHVPRALWANAHEMGAWKQPKEIR